MDEPTIYYEQSEQINDIALALSRVQGKLANAAKDATNPEFGKQYADLASCWDACRESLAENQIAVVQFPLAKGQAVTVTTLLVHSSGQYFRSRLELLAESPRPHSVGSAITYARRYALCAMVGISPADDDGNAASGKGTAQGRAQSAPEQRESVVTTVNDDRVTAVIDKVLPNGGAYLVEDTGSTNKGEAQPAPKKNNVVQMPAPPIKGEPTVQEQVAELTKSILESTSGLKQKNINEFFCGWFSVSKIQECPKGHENYLEPLQKLASVLRDPKVSETMITAPRIVGDQLRNFQEPAAAEPQKSDDKEIFGNDLLERFKWTDINTALWAEQYMEKMALDANGLELQLKTMQILALAEEDILALLKLLRFSTEAYTFWKKCIKAKMPIHMGLRMVEKELGEPITQGSNAALVVEAIQKASATLA